MIDLTCPVCKKDVGRENLGAEANSVLRLFGRVGRRSFIDKCSYCETPGYRRKVECTMCHKWFTYISTFRSSKLREVCSPKCRRDRNAAYKVQSRKKLQSKKKT